jgi:hypothetical protein
MHVKDHNQVGNWNFKLENPSGVEVTIPDDPKGISRLNHLVRIVISVLNVYDGATGGEYTKKQRELAAEKGVSFEEYMGRVIQHQFCIRNKQTVKCLNDGWGDDIHSALSAVDGYIEKTPQVIQRAAGKMISRITPSKSRTFRGCSRCGGTSVFKATADNLGRAGKLNK